MRYFKINLPYKKREVVHSEVLRLDQEIPFVIISVDEDDERVKGFGRKDAWSNVAEDWISENFDDYIEREPTAGFGGREISEENLRERFEKIKKYKDQMESALEGEGVNELE